MILVTQTLPTVLSWSVDPQQAGIAELLEHFLAGEYLLLLPDLPVLIDDLLHQPLGALLQSLLLAVVEVRLDGRGKRGPGSGGVNLPSDDESDTAGDRSDSSLHSQSDCPALCTAPHRTADLKPDKDSVRWCEPSLYPLNSRAQKYPPTGYVGSHSHKLSRLYFVSSCICIMLT